MWSKWKFNQINEQHFTKSLVKGERVFVTDRETPRGAVLLELARGSRASPRKVAGIKGES